MTNSTELLTSSMENIPVASRHQTVDAILTEIKVRASEFKTIDYIYVLDDKKLVGVLSMHELLVAKPEALVETVMSTEVAFVHKSTDQEHIAQLALAQNIKAVPVVDENQHLIGVVTADTILQILSVEHTEDLLRYAGVSFSATQKFSTFTIFQHFKSRIPWLCLGLGGGLLAAIVIQRFHTILETEIILAAFIPAIVYIADAVGSQTQMVYVRTLTQSVQQSLAKIISRELVVASMLGSVLASLIFVAVLLWSSSLTIAVTLGFAVLVTTIFSVLVAILLPWTFFTLGKDPAVATGPLATVIRDVSSLSIYLLIAAQLVL